MSHPLRIAILGAPGTGKSTLASALQPTCSATVVHRAPASPDDASAYRKLFDLTLLMGLDVSAPQSNPEPQATIDKTLRDSLDRHALPYTLVYGQGKARHENALLAIRFHLRDTQGLPTTTSRWRWTCEKCSDPDCEHQLFRDLLRNN